MTQEELQKKVREIEILTRRDVNQLFSGEYHSIFKGKGMSFSEVREYQYGDDFRAIDWNVSARFDYSRKFEKLFVKQYEEERELTVFLLVDASNSGNFGTNKEFKSEIATLICAALSFSANKNNDKVGMLLFTDELEKIILPAKGKTHIQRIISDLVSFKAKSNKTNIAKALQFVSSSLKKRSIIFIISDFMDNDYETPLKIASKKHDVIAIRVVDKLEEKIPNVGLIKFIDSETGEIKLVDTSAKYFNLKYNSDLQKREEKLKLIFNKYDISEIVVRTGEKYYEPLQKFFKMRLKRLRV